MSHPDTEMCEGRKGQLVNYLMEICTGALGLEGAWPHRNVPEVTLRRARLSQVVSGIPEGVTLQSGPFLLQAITQGEPVGGWHLQPWQWRTVLRE